MNDAVMKAIAGICILGGETLMIYQEMAAARVAKTGGLTFFASMWMVAWIALAGALLLAGYYFGYVSTKNIWVIAVLSVGVILIVEPILMVKMFHETPTPGAWAGMAFAVLGIFATLLF